MTSTLPTSYLYGAIYDLEQSRHDCWENRLGCAWDRLIGAPLVAAVEAWRPDVIIATHYFPAVVLGPLRTSGRLRARLFVVITDMGAHDWWVEKGVDGYFVASDAVARALARRRVDPSRICVTGIPVVEAFARIEPLRVDGARTPAALVVCGALGIGPLERVVRSFAGSEAFRLFVVAGKNPRLVERLAQIVDDLELDAQVYGYVEDLPTLMEMADIVVTKAGGLTTCEALAAGRPLVLTAVVPGQELRNVEAVLEAGAGVVATEPEDCAHRAGELTADRATLLRYAAAARRLSRPAAAYDLVDIAVRRLGAAAGTPEAQGAAPAQAAE